MNLNSLDDIVRLLEKMPEEERKAVIETARKENAGFLWKPNPGPQTQAYFSPADMVYYGGSAGGGKSQLMLGLAVNEHRVSRLFRRQFKDIDGEGGLAPALAQIVGSSRGYNSQKHVWKIPPSLTGGIPRAVEFGAFETPRDAEAYQGRPADLFAFDEAVQFQYDLIRYITAWNRPAPGVPSDQRCRVILGSNPPVTPEGLWIFDLFAPWLDPDHHNPALPGELRWFAMVNGVEIEVDRDYQAVIVDAGGNELVVRPKSRTFIPASLSDNPDLLDSGYASQLASLPKYLQDAFAAGKFSTTLEDAERQVIPTAWVLKAQERWMHQKKDLIERPMDALGVDVASGGIDRMVCAPLHRTTFAPLQSKPGSEVRDASQKFAFVMSVAKDDPQFNVDNNGYGDDLCSALESNNFKVRRIKASFKPTRKAKDGREFENLRAQLVWTFREALHPEHGDSVALPPGRDIVMQLTAFREMPHEDMRRVIRIESNDDIKKRIGRSPDDAWAIFFAWADPSEVMREQRASHIRERSDRERRRGSHAVNRSHANVLGRRK